MQRQVIAVEVYTGHQGGVIAFTGDNGKDYVWVPQKDGRLCHGCVFFNDEQCPEVRDDAACTGEYHGGMDGHWEQA